MMARDCCCLAFLLALVGCRGDVDHAADVRKHLHNSDADVRRAALEELSQMGSLNDEQVTLVVDALRDSEPAVRRAAAQTLALQAEERPELAPQLVAWAEQTDDARCREVLEQAAVGKPLERGD
jgi:HEAT repeat protein